MKYHYEIEQNTAEWLKIKNGKFSASKASDLLMASDKKGYQALIYKIATERITGMSVETYSDYCMRRGLELEPEAGREYEIETFTKLHRVGFVEMTEWIGCSPDFLIGEDGLLQIKCPKYNTHWEYHLTKQFPSAYVKRCQFELMVTDRKYNILRSYYPGLQSYQQKIDRDEQIISEIKTRLAEAIIEVKEKIKQFERN